MYSKDLTRFGKYVLVRAIAFLLWAWPNPNQAQEDQLPQEAPGLQARIAALAEPSIEKREHCRLTIGVLYDGKRYIVSFGNDQPSAADTADEKLIYEIGSVTKVFTSILFAQAEQEGLLALDDPVSNHLPKGFTVSPEMGAITLRQLATHTSGLPRLPHNLDPTSNDPYAKYDADGLKECLRTVKLDYPPGKKQVYSNLGVALLGSLVAAKDGRLFEELLQEKICQPLVMPDATTRLADAQVARLVAGHSPNGEMAAN